MTRHPQPASRLEARVRRNHRAEWARIDTPPWRRIARTLADTIRAYAWRAVTW